MGRMPSFTAHNNGLCISLDTASYGLRFPNNFKDASWLGFKAPGLCGGMSYTVLDGLYSGVPAPKITSTPSTDSKIGAYIKQRQLDSFISNGAKFLEWIYNPSDSSILESTFSVEWPKLVSSINNRVPVPIGLIAGGKSFLESALSPTDSHQVVALGYSTDANWKYKIYCWDPNDSANKVGGHKAAVIKYDPERGLWVGPGKRDLWRGFFVEDYEPKRPPWGEQA